MAVVCEALNIDLTERRIKKIQLTMEVNEPITLYLEEYATFSDGQPYLLASALELATFVEPQPQHHLHEDQTQP